MMASIPNMRSAPLPVPAAKAPPAGDAAGGFSVELPAPANGTPGTGPGPGQPCIVAPPIESLEPAELLSGLVPGVAAPEGTEGGLEDDGKSPENDVAPKDGVEIQPGNVIPFVPPLPTVPAPQVAAGPAGTQAPSPAAEAVGAAPAGKKAAPAPDNGDVPDAETDTPALRTAAEAAVKALLQRKAPSTKQVAAKPATTDTARVEPAAAKDAPRSQAAQTPAVQVAAPVLHNAVPLAAAEPALSPAAPQSAPAAGDKVATVEGTRNADLAVERKLDLSRDGAWLDRLARDIARSASDDSPLRFRLHPQTLGSLHVELQQGDRGTAVRMTVDTEAARQILTDAQPRLTAEARAQGVRIAETHVEMSSSGRHAPGDQRRQDEARQTPFIRTATGAGSEANAARTSSRTRADRYA